MNKYTNLSQTKAFSKLKKKAAQKLDLNNLLTAKRLKNYYAENDPLKFFYATALIDDEVLAQMQELSNEQKVIEKYQKILNQEIMNIGENRKVLHHVPRSTNRGMYGEEQKKITDFALKIHSGLIKSYSGKPFDTVVQIGIGGSDLGPRAFYLALERFVAAKKGKLPLTAFFISNVDPDDANSILNKINVETTLFIVVSKSGTTQETLTNLALVKQKARAKGIGANDIKNHFIAVTGKNSPMDNPEEYLASFYIDDNIGGRFSVTSAVGGTVLSLAFGPEIFEEILEGAYLLDKQAQNPNIKENISLLAALIGVWERNFLGYPTKAIIPYSEALSRFPAHLQQVDCESNGKSVNIYFEPLDYETGPVIFGEPGTNGQHSFFQKLHQGTDVIPIQFIGFNSPQIESDIITFGTLGQNKLIANLVAQIIALALGQKDQNLNKNFCGNRPSTLIFADKLTPKTLGALLAYYENLIMFQGFLWNINSFDQEGVQLGKLLTKKILEESKTENSILKDFYNLLIK
ncbi:MAG: glucose-6-phosphate isomerase [Candidatus Margulisiibacteriota bacterium]|jgi:glucose-6-phosphate isomerase